jgi:fimbrial chaperone protein
MISSVQITRRYALVSLLLASLLGHGAAARADMSVSPMRLAIERGERTAAVTVTNPSGEAVRFQVRGFAWGELPGQPVKLTPADDLIAFPTIGTLEAHESRVIRVGVTGTASDAERSYRLVVTELPPPQTAAAPGPAAITFRTAFNIPVFLEPQRPASHLVATGAALRGSRLSFSIDNDGNAHERLQSVEVTGLDATGASLFTTSVDGWYVLAHSRWEGSAAIPATACGRVRSVRLVAKSETKASGATWTVPATTSDCT